ncbi:hypothetical protein [Bacillus sp. V2I10]|uniref:hypothetical protein n=1 Tax=Bacillus sp. V2I10 TaxID=3042276 RepID=UPI0027895D5E|nr:hypothetical protein [Bacillus sp. V2I10]MDQ0860011.1 hypothetical protein [Bacillus sp. V2I10]
MLSHPNFLKLKQINENDVLMINGKPLNIIGIDDFNTKRSDIHKSFKGLANGYNLVVFLGNRRVL